MGVLRQGQDDVIRLAADLSPQLPQEAETCCFGRRRREGILMSSSSTVRLTKALTTLNISFTQLPYSASLQRRLWTDRSALHDSGYVSGHHMKDKHKHTNKGVQRQRPCIPRILFNQLCFRSWRATLFLSFTDEHLKLKSQCFTWSFVQIMIGQSSLFLLLR